MPGQKIMAGGMPDHTRTAISHLHDRDDLTGFRRAKFAFAYALADVVLQGHDRRCISVETPPVHPAGISELATIDLGEVPWLCDSYW
eukprot:1446022-Amphidinium_carterae.1